MSYTIATHHESAPLETSDLRQGAGAELGRSKLAGVQYLRGLAALAIVWHHASVMQTFPWYYGRGHAISGLDAGVDLFFCLSGFIIACVTLDRDLRPKMSVQEFVRRRFARIIPFLWFCVLTYAGLQIAAGGKFDASSFIRAMTLFPIGAVNPGVVWTLRHEALFYVIFALAFLAPARSRWLLVAWVVSPIALALCGFQKTVDNPSAGHQLAAFVFSQYNLTFGVGVASGIVYKVYGDRIRRLAVPAMVPIGFAVALMALEWPRVGARSIVRDILPVSLLGAAALLSATAVRAPRGWFGAFGEMLGDASYSIYLTHLAFLSAGLRAAVRHWPSPPEQLMLFVLFVVSVAAGVAIHYAVERPLVAWGQSIAERFSLASLFAPAHEGNDDAEVAVSAA